MLRKLTLAAIFRHFTFSQTKNRSWLVGLVIDQMRWDYLYRYDALRFWVVLNV